MHDFSTLLEFAANGITPLVSPCFKPESINVAPLRDRYLKLHHTIDKLLCKLYKDGTMILLRKQDAMRIDGLHLSLQHHADSIGDLSGQHDQHFTPLNGSLHDKDQLRAAIALKWGDIKHPTVDQLVKMVLTSAEHGYHFVEKRFEGRFQSS